MRAQDHAVAGAASTLIGSGTYLAMLLALRKKKLSTLARHLIAGGTGLLAGGATYGTIGWLSNKYAETADQMRANIAKSGLPIEVIDTKNGPMLRTTEDYKYTIDGVERVIPKGFGFDGVSGPVVFNWLFGGGTDPRTLRAGMKHDYEYHIADGKVSKSQADDHFMKTAIEDGLPESKAKAMRLGLALGGWVPYYKNRLSNN